MTILNGGSPPFFLFLSFLRVLLYGFLMSVLLWSESFKELPEEYGSLKHQHKREGGTEKERERKRER